VYCECSQAVIGFTNNQNSFSRLFSLLWVALLWVCYYSWVLSKALLSSLCSLHLLTLFPSTLIMPSTPPTSPQRHQEAARHAERSSRLMASPEQRRTPAGPSTASTSAAPPPLIAQAPSGEPTTYGQQTFYHLPPDLAVQVQSLLPLHPLRGRPSSSTLGPPPVSLIFILII
jgi:hypothetical protein